MSTSPSSAARRHADEATPGAQPPVPILVVDDHPGKRLALKSILRPLDYAIFEADSGLAALRHVTAQDFAVILLDVRMPQMDGFETAALIRQRRQSEMTPIIFITAYATDEIENANRYADGAVDFISAPVIPDELRAKVSVFANIFRNAGLLTSQANAAQASADHLRLLTDAAPIGIFQTDTENRYVYTNPRWSEITGVGAGEALGHSWENIMGGEPSASTNMPGGPGGRSEFSHRFELPARAGGPRIVLVTSKPIPADDGGVAGWVGTLADVSTEVGAEAATSEVWDEGTAARRPKLDFLASLSHEIRTPMNGVIALTDLLLETDLDARQRDYAQSARDSGEALMTIINDILEFSKVEDGTLELEQIEFSLRTIVDDVVDLLAGPVQAKGLNLLTVIAKSVPDVVIGDPGRVRQVLTKLIGNAIKFTETGDLVVRMTEPEQVGAEMIIRFEISDTGDGITADKRASVFQPFLQADTDTPRSYGRTGLDLAMCGQLVGLMGGECGLSSQLDTGSGFWFTIRVHTESGTVTHDPPTSASEAASVAAGSKSNGRP